MQVDALVVLSSTGAAQIRFSGHQRLTYPSKATKPKDPRQNSVAASVVTGNFGQVVWTLARAQDRTSVDPNSVRTVYKFTIHSWQPSNFSKATEPSAAIPK